MIIDQLPLLLGDALLTDEFPIERGTTSYKATLEQILGLVFSEIEPNFAGAYDSTATYSVGDYVVYEHDLYVCNTAIPTAEDWTAAHWTQTDIGTVLESLKSDIDTLGTSKQDKITANGILKGNGSGGVSAAVAGTDYLTPATNYSPVVTKSSDYTLAASDSGKTIIFGASAPGDVTITIDRTVLGSLPFGAEIAFVKDNNQSYAARLKIVNIAFGNETLGWTAAKASGVYAVIPKRYGMIALKKTFDGNSSMMLFGNVEVVT